MLGGSRMELTGGVSVKTMTREVSTSTNPFTGAAAAHPNPRRPIALAKEVRLARA